MWKINVNTEQEVNKNIQKTFPNIYLLLEAFASVNKFMALVGNAECRYVWCGLNCQRKFLLTVCHLKCT